MSLYWTGGSLSISLEKPKYLLSTSKHTLTIQLYKHQKRISEWEKLK